MALQFGPLSGANLLLINHLEVDGHRGELHVPINFQNSVHHRPQNSLDIGQPLDEIKGIRKGGKKGGRGEGNQFSSVVCDDHLGHNSFLLQEIRHVRDHRDLMLHGQLEQSQNQKFLTGRKGITIQGQNGHFQERFHLGRKEWELEMELGENDKRKKKNYDKPDRG